jgi:hypothetical protein
VVMCDGASRFISETIDCGDLTVTPWPALEILIQSV